MQFIAVLSVCLALSGSSIARPSPIYDSSFDPVPSFSYAPPSISSSFESSHQDSHSSGSTTTITPSGTEQTAYDSARTADQSHSTISYAKDARPNPASVGHSQPEQ
ncbi:hypothetical protein PGT21_010709 [Puccinia graminis f. sp. tritici]|uniref:Uncharacterized protein n=1 Tax=Puccinia graminis f. sp. tritici TaxID=56615 RepID=A0A5B0MLK5_PUCGR|nr:hypothetical protein PGT21_010709 [Puccinia graminis f. sp. tritici]